MSNNRESFISSYDKAENYNSEILSTTEKLEHNLKKNNVFQEMKEKVFIN